MTAIPACPACSGPRTNLKHYLCGGCWFTLPRAARGALLRRDAHAGARLIELRHQLRDGVALHEIKITTR